ncbi:MAG: ABC transporter ATP-binding protein, partial [Spirochaetota bacterium]
MISAQGVHKHYVDGETEVHALRGVDLTIDAGEFISIAGPSGSGKSTLLNLIGCLDSADKGEISINGTKVAGQKAAALVELRRQHIGFVFQGFNLLPALRAW